MNVEIVGIRIFGIGTNRNTSTRECSESVFKIMDGENRINC